MNIERLQKYYNDINKCSIVMNQEVDFEYIQTQISKIAIYTEDLNRIIGEILINITQIEHTLTDSKFEYELNFTDKLKNDIEIQKLATVKERTNYINYFILKEDYRKIVNLEQELRDGNSLLGLAKKKAKDLDKSYPKLRTLWESVQAEMKFIKKVGSDDVYMDRVKDSISEDQRQIKPIFTDNLVEQINNDQYNNKEGSSVTLTKENSEIDVKVDDLLSDL